MWDILLKVNLRALVDELNVSCERKREIKDDSCVLKGLSIWMNDILPLREILKILCNEQIGLTTSEEGSRE